MLLMHLKLKVESHINPNREYLMRIETNFKVFTTRCTNPDEVVEEE